MAEIKAKIEKLELRNGETVELTINFAKMLWLRSNGYAKEVENAMRVLNAKEIDFLDMPYYFYAAYLCGLKTTDEPAYTQKEFIELMPWDMGEVARIYGELISEKKTKLSKTHLNAKKQKAK